jgi:hypothetical protein
MGLAEAMVEVAEALVGALMRAFVEVVEALVGALVETVVGALVGTVVEALVEALVEAVVEALVEAVVEALVEVVEALVGALVEVVEAVVEVFVEAVVEALVEALVEAVVGALVVDFNAHSIMVSPSDSPSDSSKNASKNSSSSCYRNKQSTNRGQQRIKINVLKFIIKTMLLPRISQLGCRICRPSGFLGFSPPSRSAQTHHDGWESSPDFAKGFYYCRYNKELIRLTWLQIHSFFFFFLLDPFSTGRHIHHPELGAGASTYVHPRAFSSRQRSVHAASTR